MTKKSRRREPDWMRCRPGGNSPRISTPSKPFSKTWKLKLARLLEKRPKSDQDRIKDEQDKCPNQAEDHDQFEDEDGCPDPDNDRDGIPDVRDRCPLQAETINQVDDYDGCPDERAQPASTQGALIGLSEKIFFKHNENQTLD